MEIGAGFMCRPVQGQKDTPDIAAGIAVTRDEEKVDWEKGGLFARRLIGFTLCRSACW